MKFYTIALSLLKTLCALAFERFALIQFSSVQFNRSVVSNCLWPHESQHAKPPCPSPTPGVQTHIHRVSDAIQPSHPLSSPSPPAPQSLPASESFPMSQLFAWGGQSTGVSASASFPPNKPRADLLQTGLVGSPSVQGTLKSLLQHHSSKASILWYSAFFIVQLSHPYVTTGITIALTRWTFVDRVMSLLFNMLSGLVIAFLPRRKRL